MKKKLLITLLTLAFIISVSLNISAYRRISQMKDFYLYGIYSDLINISVLLDNALHFANREDLIYFHHQLENASRQLSMSVQGLNALSSGTDAYAAFSHYASIMWSTVNDNQYNTAMVKEYQERTTELIRELSPDKELQSDYTLSRKPNYSLSAKEIKILINEIFQ